MKYKDHTYNKNIAFVLMAIFCITIFLFGVLGCGLVSKAGGESNTKTNTSEASSDTTSAKKSGGGSYFDQSTIDEEDLYLNFEPIDPSKEMKIINPDGSTTTTTNAKRTSGKKNTNTQKNTGGDYYTKEEINRLIEQSKASAITEEESWFKTFRIAIPWYAYVIFAIVILFAWYSWRTKKKIKALKKIIT